MIEGMMSACLLMPLVVLQSRSHACLASLSGYNAAYLATIVGVLLWDTHRQYTM